MKEVFGKPVQNLQCKDPQNTVHDVKRLIGRKMTDKDLDQAIKNMQFSVVDKNGLPQICVSAGSFSPEEISGKLLAEFKRVADKYLKVPIKKAVITVPAYFNDDQRRATQKAGELAGFQVLQLLNEPTAAAIAYKLQRLNEKARKVVIFDLGGGTFDVAVLDVGDKIEVQSIGGDPILGGIDFDIKLMNHCIAKYKRENDCTEIEDLLSTKDEQSRRRRARFLRTCEELKKQLSFTETQTLDANWLIYGKDVEVEVTRAEFEGLIATDLEKMINIVDKTLKKVNVETNAVDDIVLVGGCTRIPKLQEMLTNFFPGRQLNVSIDPDQAVAYGAAMQAALLNGMMISKDFPNFSGVQDITPMSFGIECIMNGRRGMFSKLIENNSKIPAEGQDIYLTSQDDQKNVRIRIFQGDSSHVADNFFLGEFLLTGIPPGRARSQQVDVIMKITPMGIMHVEAVCKTTGSSTSKSLTITKTKNTYDQGRGIENI